MHKIEKLTLQNGSHISYMRTMCDSGATVICLGGFSSEMKGPKATHLFNYCYEQKIDCIVFDYPGHGVSSGDFSHYTVSDWFRSCCTLINTVTDKPIVLVGTSMGGWIMMHVAAHFGEKVIGAIGLASAPDFTEELCINSDEKKEFLEYGSVTSFATRICGLLGMSKEASRLEVQRVNAENCKEIFATGSISVLKHGRSYTITPKLKRDGKLLLLLDKASIPVKCDTTLIHSIVDDVIPHTASIFLAEKLQSKNVDVHLIKSSNHLLNDTEPLALAFYAIRKYVREA